MREVSRRDDLHWRQPSLPAAQASQRSAAEEDPEALRSSIQRHLPRASHPTRPIDTTTTTPVTDDPFADPFGDRRAAGPRPARNQQPRRETSDGAGHPFSIAAESEPTDHSITLIPSTIVTQSAELTRSTTPPMQLRLEARPAPPASLRLREPKLNPPTSPDFHLDGPQLAQVDRGDGFEISLDDVEIPQDPQPERLPISPDPMPHRAGPVLQIEQPPHGDSLEEVLSEEHLLNELHQVNPIQQTQANPRPDRSDSAAPRTYQRPNRERTRPTSGIQLETGIEGPQDTEPQLSPEFDPSNTVPPRQAAPTQGAADLDLDPVAEPPRSEPPVPGQPETMFAEPPATTQQAPDLDTVDPFAQEEPLPSQPFPTEATPTPQRSLPSGDEFPAPQLDERSLDIEPDARPEINNDNAFGDFDLDHSAMQSDSTADALDYDLTDDSDDSRGAASDCGRVYNGRDCCDIDSQCREAFESLHENTTRAISLDTAPPFLPLEEDDAKVMEERSKRLNKLPSRSWSNREGQHVADGKLEGMRYNRVVIRKDDGDVAEIPFRELGGDELCFATAWWNLPVECVVPTDNRYQRCWTPITYTWTASSSCHKPLYFEEVGLERYGHSAGPLLQPLVSAAQFYANVLLLPYNMGVYTPVECRYPLGHYRPGSCAPWQVPAFPLSKRGALSELSFILGLWGYVQ